MLTCAAELCPPGDNQIRSGVYRFSTTTSNKTFRLLLTWIVQRISASLSLVTVPLGPYVYISAAQASFHNGRLLG